MYVMAGRLPPRVRPSLHPVSQPFSLVVVVVLVTVGGPEGRLVWCLMKGLAGNAQPKLGTPLLMDRPVNWIWKESRLSVILLLFQMRVLLGLTPRISSSLKVSRNVVEAVVAVENKDDTNNNKKRGEW